MADTFNTIIARVRRRIPALTDAMGIEYARKVDRIVLSKIPLRVRSYDIAQVADQWLYDLPAGTVTIWDAVYVQSANQRFSMQATSFQELTADEAPWQHRTGESIRRYFVWGNTDQELQFGVRPTPTASASGGYPKFELWITQTQTISTGTETIPQQLDHSTVYEDGIEWLACSDLKSTQEQAEAKAKFQSSLRDEMANYSRLNRNFSPTVQPNTFRRYAR